MTDEDRNIVIIGRTSSGKSELVKTLGERGYNILPEIGRTVLNFRKSDNPSPEEIAKRNEIMFNTQMYFEGIAEGTVFFERALPCAIAYTNYYLGNIPWEFEGSEMRGRYHKVFSLEGLKFEHDGLRIESGEEEAQRIQEAVEETYRIFGYHLVKVPKFSENKEESLEKRIDFVLNNLN